MAEQSVTLEPGESKVVSFEAIPTVAKTYQVTMDGLSGSFKAVAIPDIKLISLTWDATPPFEFGWRNYEVTMRNLVASSITYRLKYYMNGELLRSWNEPLAANEQKTRSFSYDFRTEGTYTLKIQAFYQEELLDEISSTVGVRAPIAPHGRIIRALVYDASKAGTAEAWIQVYPPIVYLPLNVPLVTYVDIENNGLITASFYAVLLGVQTPAISIAPGGRGNVSAPLTSRAGSFPIILYGNGQELWRDTIQVIGS
ncbi:hypothetical protein ES705_13358 [subsurface metagenome]